jgi:hypothetical protein
MTKRAPLQGRLLTTGEAMNARGALPFAMTGLFFRTSFLTLGVMSSAPKFAGARAMPRAC